MGASGSSQLCGCPPLFFFNPGSAVGRLVESRNQEERPGPSFLLVEPC